MVTLRKVVRMKKVPTAEPDKYEDLENSICKLTTKVTNRDERNGKLLRIILGAAVGFSGVAAGNDHVVHTGNKIIKGCQTCE